MLTRKGVCKHIKKVTGYDVTLTKGDGYYYFHSDDDATGLMLAGLPSTSVYVYRLNHMTLDKWLMHFKIILNGDGA